MPTSKHSFVSHDDIYLTMSITRAILLNGYFLRLCSFFWSTVYFVLFYINCTNELQSFWKNYSGKTSPASEMLFLIFFKFSCCNFQPSKKTCPKTHMQKMVKKWWDYSCCKKNNISMFTYMTKTYLGRTVSIQTLIYSTLFSPILPPLKKDLYKVLRNISTKLLVFSQTSNLSFLCSVANLVKNKKPQNSKNKRKFTLDGFFASFSTF